MARPSSSKRLLVLGAAVLLAGQALSQVPPAVRAADPSPTPTPAVTPTPTPTPTPAAGDPSEAPPSPPAPITTADGTTVVVQALSATPTATGVFASDGQLVTFSATGTWCMGIGECGTAAGIRPANPPEFPLILDTAMIGTLIGRVGGGSWFAIGASGQIVMPNDGALVLLFNDRAPAHYYGDNSGSVSVTISPLVPDQDFPGDRDKEHNNVTSPDPVGTFAGDFRYSFTDIAIPGRGPSPTFTRSYSSAETRVGTLGPGWTSNYDVRLRSPSDSSVDLLFVGATGATDRYTHNVDGTFSPPPAVYRTLVANIDGTYTATELNQSTWTFDGAGNLIAIADPFGNTSTLTYSSGQLTSVSDPAGRGSLSFGYTNGLLTSITDWASPVRTVSYQYDANGRLWKVTDREGQTTTFGYDGSTARLTTITDAKNHVAVTMTYDAAGRVATQQDAQGLLTGATTTFDYVVNGDGTRVTTMTLPATSFEPAFNPTIVDTYNAQGWLTSRVSDPSTTESLTESFGYDATGNPISITDARGFTTDLCYDTSYAGVAIAGSRGNLTRRIDPAPTAGANRPVTLFAYDARNNPMQIVAPKGVPSGTSVTCSTDLSAVNSAYATDRAYDPTGAMLLSRTSRFSDPDLGLQTAITKFEYADAANPGMVTRVIPPRGNTGPSPDYTYATSLSYGTTGSQAGMLTATGDALGNTTAFAYDVVGRLTSSVGALGNAPGGVPAEHSSTVTYDKEDRVRFSSAPAPQAGGSPLTTEQRYDEVGNRTVQIDASGQVTTYAYDSRDGLFEVKESPNTWTDPLSPPSGVITTEYAYDAAGNLTRMTRAKGDAANERVTDYVYDGRNLVRRETQFPSWPTTTPTLVTTSTYDPNGNPLTLLDPLGQTTTSTYDRLNRLTGIDYSSAGTPDVTYAYDANGNRSSMLDGTGTTTYAYDESNRLTLVTSPGPKTVGYRYDLDGNRRRLIYPDGTAVDYTFNKASQLASLSDWASRSVSYTYWPDGALRTATNPDSSVATHAYDNARRLNDILHTRSGAQLARFLYTLDPLGNVTSVANGTNDLQFERPDGLVSSNGTWTGTFANINEVTPNDATLLASPSNPTTANYYEVSLADVLPPFVTSGTVFRYRYAKSGNNSGKTINLTVELRQGTTVIATGTHTNIPGATGSGWQQANITLTAPQAALITNVADLRLRFRPSSSGGGQPREAQISWAEVQLPATLDPATLFAYGYDRLSRLTSVTGADGPRSYTYDPPGNRLTKVASSTTTYTYDRADRLLTAGATAVTVDANGNTTAKGSDTFAFDQANRLTGSTVAGATETYTYDGDGVRFSRTVGVNPAIRYVSDMNASLPVTVDAGARKYVWGVGLAYAAFGSALEIYHTDRLSSVRVITDAAGTVVATFRTDEYGVPTATTGTSTQPFRYAGEPRDATGLLYVRARYVDPALGRFMTRDLWPGSGTASSTLNRYVYGLNNPTTLIDPSGHKSLALDPGFGGRRSTPPPVARQSSPGGVFGCDLVSTAYGVVLVCSGEADRNQPIERGPMGFMDPGVAEKIAGHAWPLREAEFQDAFGEEFEQGDLQNLIQGVLAGEFDKTQEGPNGQTAYWDQDNGLIVIYNPNDEEQGTAFLPDDPADYWYEHLWQD